jgi:apolipoprotein D and lipocalin family protein
MLLKRPSLQKATSVAFFVSFVVATCAVLQACSATPNGSSSFAPRSSSLPQTVDSVDLDRYLGRWFEIARLPNRFQDLCKSNVVATYSRVNSGAVKVENRCLNEAGEIKEAIGEARSVETNNSKLEVRFAPGWLSWLPLVWGDYWVLYLESDYSVALVGSPDRQFLWVLSRNSSMEKAKLDFLLGKAREQGYAAEKVLVTVQKSVQNPVQKPVQNTSQK